MSPEPHQLAEEGRRAFADGRFAEAARLFEQAAEGFTLGRDGLHAAEMRNNLSVTLLQDKKPQQALDAAAGTDKIFEAASDVKRQAMALGNQAAALEALGRLDQALQLYERAAELFANAREGDLRSMVLKSAAAIRLRQGKVTESAMKMLGSLNAVEKPTLLQRILKFFLRLRS